MSRFSIRTLVTVDLHYCCLWFFFSRFKRTALIAARLGVTPQAVRACRASCGRCEGKPECMDRHVTLKLKPRATREDV